MNPEGRIRDGRGSILFRRAGAILAWSAAYVSVGVVACMLYALRRGMEAWE